MFKSLEYYINGEAPTSVSPSVSYSTIVYQWFSEKTIKGRPICHRLNNFPAFVIVQDGVVVSTRYLVDDNLHRENGPAIVEYDSYTNTLDCYFYLNGCHFAEEEYLADRYENGKLDISFVEDFVLVYKE